LVSNDAAPNLDHPGRTRHAGFIRSSADTGILRIAGAYDDQMHLVPVEDATPIALHNSRPHLNGRAHAEAEVVWVVRSLA